MRLALQKIFDVFSLFHFISFESSTSLHIFSVRAKFDEIRINIAFDRTAQAHFYQILIIIRYRLELAFDWNNLWVARSMILSITTLSSSSSPLWLSFITPSIQLNPFLVHHAVRTSIMQSQYGFMWSHAYKVIHRPVRSSLIGVNWHLARNGRFCITMNGLSCRFWRGVHKMV